MVSLNSIVAELVTAQYVCRLQAQPLQPRTAWLADSLDETLDTGLDWDAELDAEGNAVWGNLNETGFPCLRNMPEGAPVCQ